MLKSPGKVGFTRKTSGWWPERYAGAKLILDWQGARTNKIPLYWYDGRYYPAMDALSGWTFTGGTTTNGAVRYAEDAAGNLVAFASGLPRITNKGFLVEEARTNLLTYSQQFDNAAWVKTAATVSQNSTAAPDGTTTADTLVESNTLATHFLRQDIAFSGDGVATTTVYLKAAGRTRMRVELVGNVGGSGMRANVDLAAGTVSTTMIGTPAGSGTATIDRLANDWWRVTIVATPGSTGNTGRSTYVILCDAAGNATYQGDGTSGIYLWQADLQAGSFPTSPIVTTGAAATRAADNASVTGLESILGQFRTNILPRSNNWTSVAWSSTNAAVTVSADPGPNGGGSWQFSFSVATAGSSRVFNNSSTSVFGANTWTGSVWLRADSATVAQIRISSNGIRNVATQSVNITTAWQRFTVTGTGVGSDTGIVGFDVASNGASGVTIYGADAMVETGSTATAYIPTTGTAASAGNPVTLVAWADLPAADGVNRILANPSDGTTAQRTLLRRGLSNDAGVFFVPGGSAATAAGKTGARTLKIASRQRAALLSGAIDGGTVQSISAAGPAGQNQVKLGSGIANDQYLNGYIQRVIILGDTSDTQLAKLTL